MLFSIINSAMNGYLREALIQLILTIPILVIALSFHEAAHGYVAYKCGDRTAYNLGRVTLNPAKHLDLWGMLSMFLIGYGWAKPVPINSRNFNNPKKGMAITALAGPATNLILAVISTIFSALSWVLYYKSVILGIEGFRLTLIYMLYYFFFLSALYNFMLMAFNLIPFPPFDGSRFALSFLPADKYFAIMRYERQILLAIIIVLFLLSRLGFSPFFWIAEKLYNLLYNPFETLFANLIL